MLQLLSLEWMKIRRYRTFWVLLILFCALLTLLYTGISTGIISLGAGEINLLGKAYNFSGIWGDLGFYASYFIVVITILMIILVTNEFQFRTHRQNIIDGWTRLEFYHAKWLVLISLSVIVTLFTFILGLVTGIASGIPIGTAAEGLQKILWLFLSCIDYLGFALLLSVLLKRSGIAIGILMAYLMLLEPILHSVLVYFYRLPYADLFLPLQCSDEMLPMKASKLMRAAIQTATPSDWQYALATGCWILVFYLVGRQKMLKGDW
jgi:hypothetical protein